MNCTFAAMMNRIVTLAAALLVSASCFGQQKAPVSPYAATDKAALKMPDSVAASTISMARYISAQFPTEAERVRAAYIWVASNIQYDVANMFALNFYEKPEEKVTKALATRKGVCEAYATLFQDVCSKMGVKSFVVTGYTKQNGFADYIPHAWVAAQAAGEWRIYDPTWGSGYISNGKFVKKLNESYYAARPQSIIKSHMPFDPLWQALYYPVNNQEFYDGKIAENKSKPYFSYPDSIVAYEAMSISQQLAGEARRIEAAGTKNAMIFDRLHHIKGQQENLSIDLYNGAIFDYNAGINQLNDFITYRNAKFEPMKPDAEIQGMLTKVTERFNDAKTKLKSINQPNSRNAPLIIQLMKNVDDATTQRDEMQEWLTKYFTKSKMGRRSMFYKITWYGIPLN
jgi:hypothetical protein